MTDSLSFREYLTPAVFQRGLKARYRHEQRIKTGGMIGCDIRKYKIGFIVSFCFSAFWKADEYLSSYNVHDLEEGKQVLDFVIRLYNEERPHMSLGNLPPNTIHDEKAKPEQLWRNYYQKNSTIVNPFQDNDAAVNLLQDVE